MKHYPFIFFELIYTLIFSTLTDKNKYLHFMFVNSVVTTINPPVFIWSETSCSDMTLVMQLPRPKGCLSPVKYLLMRRNLPVSFAHCNLSHLKNSSNRYSMNYNSAKILALFFTSKNFLRNWILLQYFTALLWMNKHTQSIVKRSRSQNNVWRISGDMIHI